MHGLFKSWKQDVPASLVVFLVALPLCLGIAVGSNAPPMSGIIAGIVGGLVIGFASGSPLSVSGPAAGLTAIVVGALEVLPFEQFLVSVVLAGAMQIAFGYARAGIIGDYVPNAVIKGMLASIGIILVLKQLPHLVGHDADYEGDETFLQPDAHNTFSELLYSIEDITPLATVIGMTCLALIFLLSSKALKDRVLFRYIPVPLIVVLVGVFLDQWLHGDVWALRADQRVDIPVAGSAQELAGLLTFPEASGLLNSEVWIVALTIALVGSLETLLSIEAVDKLDPWKRATPNDRELKAQGLGNVVSGMLGGLPVTSVIVRSSANVHAGGKSKLATILHGSLLLLCVVLGPQVVNYVPKAALAAILIYVGYRLARVELFQQFYQRGWDQFVPFIITIIAILLTDLLKGVAVGILVGLYYVIKSNFGSAVIHVEHNGASLLRLRKEVSFLNKPLVKRIMHNVPSGSALLVDVTRADLIDQDVVDEIEEYCKHADQRGVEVTIEHIAGRPAHKHFERFRGLPGVTVTSKH